MWSAIAWGGIAVAIAVCQPSWGRPLEWFPALGYFGYLLAGPAYYVVRARFNRRAVIINHLGVTFDTPAIPVRFVPWGDIARATFDWKTEEFRIEDRDGGPIVRCVAKDLSTCGIADKCAYEINEAKAVYLDGAG